MLSYRGRLTSPLLDFVNATMVKQLSDLEVHSLLYPVWMYFTTVLRDLLINVRCF